jgi:Domain of unknown function (DUF5625)
MNKAAENLNTENTRWAEKRCPHRMSATIAKIVAMALSLLLPACSSPKIGKSGLPIPPIRLPFAVEKAGAKIDIEIEIVDYRGYTFALDFMFKEDDQADRARIKKLVGDSPPSYSPNGDYGDPGAPTPLRFSIHRIEANASQQVVFDKQYTHLRLMSWGGDSFDKNLAPPLMPLKPGNYRIHLESLADMPEFVGIPVFFSMGSNYLKASNIE